MEPVSTNTREKRFADRCARADKEIETFGKSSFFKTGSSEENRCKAAQDFVKTVYESYDVKYISAKEELENLQNYAMPKALPALQSLLKDAKSEATKGVVFDAFSQLCFSNPRSGEAVLNAGLIDAAYQLLISLNTVGKEDLPSSVDWSKVSDSTCVAKNRAWSFIKNVTPHVQSAYPHLVTLGYARWLKATLENEKEPTVFRARALESVWSTSSNEQGKRDLLEMNVIPTVLAWKQRRESEPKSKDADAELFTCLLILANLIGSEEGGDVSRFVCTKEIAETVATALEQTLSGLRVTATGRFMDADRILFSIHNLCINDANKGLFVAYLSILVKSTRNEALQAQYCGVLWTLAQADANKAVIRAHPATMDALKAIRTQSKSPEAQKKAAGALFELERLEREAKEKEEKRPEESKSVEHVGHVMLSYNWGSQKRILELQPLLTAAGFKVWLDVDDMSGSTLDAMAAAVEGSSVVCIALSRQYKESTNCRTEAQYAFNLGKVTVPLILEPGYKPDGWLGALVGTKLYFDISQGIKEETAQSLIKELKRYAAIGAPSPATMVSAASASSGGATAVVFAPTVVLSPLATSAVSFINERARAMDNWSPDNVLEWLDKVGLPYRDSFTAQKVSGRSLVAFASLLHSLRDLEYLEKWGIRSTASQLEFWYHLSKALSQ